MTHRTVLVTGGAQGIGRSVADHLRARKWNVAVGDIDAEAAREYAEGHAGDDGLAVLPLDVADEASVAAFVAAAAERFGAIQGLVCNAGIGGPFGTPLESVALDEWRRVLDTNLTGCFLAVKHALPHLRSAGDGAVVTVASTRAVQSEPHTEPYAASKGGMVALTHALAVSCGPDVRVNCVSPGWIEVGPLKKASARTAPDHSPEDHAQHPAGRVGRPEDVASLVAYLLSAEAGFITGQNLVIDGGMTRKMIYR